MRVARRAFMRLDILLTREVFVGVGFRPAFENLLVIFRFEIRKQSR